MNHETNHLITTGDVADDVRARKIAELEQQADRMHRAVAQREQALGLLHTAGRPLPAELAASLARDRAAAHAVDVNASMLRRAGQPLNRAQRRRHGITTRNVYTPPKGRPA